MKLFKKNPLLRPKSATFCAGCPKKDLQLNKEFVFDIKIPEQEPVENKPKISIISEKIKKKSNFKQTLF